VEGSDEGIRDLPRLPPERFREGHREVGRPVTVAGVPRALEGGRGAGRGPHREGGLPECGAQPVDGVHDADPPDVPLEEPLADDGLAVAGVADAADGAASDFPDAPASAFAAAAR
ncbi:MAG: hypothetical protein RLZZ467_1338, partial [Gemmatimonadota bacterium]